MRTLLHITLTTGDSRESPASEVGADVIALLGPLLERALTGSHVPVPGDVQPACTMTGGIQGRCIALTVWGPPDDGLRPPIVTFGVAAHSRCGAKLWQTLHAHATVPLATAGRRCPPEPWVAARIEPGAALYPEAMHWLGDYERCCAHAWLARYARAQ